MRLVAFKLCSAQPRSPSSPPHPSCLFSPQEGEGGDPWDEVVFLFALPCFSLTINKVQISVEIKPVYSNFGICHGSLPH